MTRVSELAEISKRLDELTKRFDSFIETHEEKVKATDKLIAAIIEKTVAGVVWALLAYVAKAAWDNLPFFSNHHR